MAVTGTTVWTGWVGRDALSMAVYDGKLWLLTNEDNLQTAQPWRIRIYYTSDGINWTQDITWTIESMDALFYNLCQLFIHQGQLHLLCNRIDNPGGIQEDGYIFRRQAGGGWVVVCNEVTKSLYRYNRAYSNDAWIVIGGSSKSPSPDASTVWVWNGTTKIKELEDAARISAWDVIYYGGEWYASCSNMIRNRGNGTWPILHQSPPTWDGLRFSDTVYGLFNGELLWTTGGAWVNTAWPADRAPLDITIYGQIVAAAVAQFDHADIGKFYTYYNGSWTYRGQLNNRRNKVWDFQVFKNKLYACGYDVSVTRARVWRIEFSHDTTPSYWTKPTARSLVCDHEYGDTIYFGVYKDNGDPIMMSIDDDLDDWSQLYDPSSGSFIQVQTPLLRNTAYAFGYLGDDNQIQRAIDGVTFADADDNWGDDKITTMEYRATGGKDLCISAYGGRDILQTATGTKPWGKRGDIPGAPLCQLRNLSDIFIGCEGGGLYKSGNVGQTFATAGSGLPVGIDILDLELA